MFSTFKKNTGSNPEWASFFEPEEYATFLSALDHYFHSIHLDYVLGDGALHFPNNPMKVNAAGLGNVAQLCKRSEPKNYGEIVSAHFGAMFKAREFDSGLKQVAGDFEEMRKYIAVRIHDSRYVSQVGKENTLGKDLTDGLFAMIVLDLPDSISSIKPDQAIAWNKTVDELFEIGIANIKANYEFRGTKQPLDDQSLWFVTGDHFFTANLVFDLKNRPEMVGTYGSLVGLPNRHAALVYPIESIAVMNAISRLFPVILGMHEQGPGSLSDQLFWYQNGELIVLSYEITNNELNFLPPESFVELINQLGN